jgi:hypothetical protein
MGPFAAKAEAAMSAAITMQMTKRMINSVFGFDINAQERVSDAKIADILGLHCGT